VKRADDIVEAVLALLLPAALILGGVVLWRQNKADAVRAVPSARPVVGRLHVPAVTDTDKARRRFRVEGEVEIAARAFGAIGDVLDRDRFYLRSVRCWAEADYHLCALCSSGPRNELGATLVKCDAARCYWPLAVSEYERVGWYGEEECRIREDEE